MNSESSKLILGEILKPEFLQSRVESNESITNHEIEARFGNFRKDESITKFDPNLGAVIFGRIFKYLESFYSPLKTNPNYELDVFYADSIRVTIFGQGNIDLFVSFDNNLLLVPRESIRVMKKEKVSNSNVDNTDYSFRLSFSKETVFKKESFNIKNLLTSKISFMRLKKRYSYKSTTDSEYFQFDLTIADYIQNMTEPRTRSYEFEIEILDVLKMDLPEKLDRVLTEFVVFIQDNGHLSKVNEHQGVLEKYYKLQDQLKDGKKCPGNSNENLFMGMKPVSISPMNIKKISINQDYSVTVKADGDRYLLYISDRGLYLIDSNLKILPTFIKLDSDDLNQTVLDGEYITDKNLFLIFDIFVLRGQDTKQFIMYNTENPSDENTRYQKMKQFYSSYSSHSPKLDEKKMYVKLKPFQVLLKQYYFEDRLLDISNRLLRQKFEYRTDGLIFTPNKESYPYCGSTFEKTFKWKKPEDNTIDFLIEQVDSINQGNLIFNKYVLYVANNKNPSEDYEKFSPNLQNSDLTFNDVQFIYVPVLNQKVITIQDNIEIQDNTIIECSWGSLQEAWGIQNPIKKHGWIPARQRIEKTTQYLATNRVVGTANYFTTANSIWSSILRPIDLEQVFGEVTTAQPAYYVRNVNREQQTIQMTNYHNRVKEKLLAEYASAKSIIDWSCGQGGDLIKWSKLAIVSVIGFDLNQENIRRLEERISGMSNYNVPAIFAQFDSSKILFNNERQPIRNNWTSKNPPFDRFFEFYGQYKFEVGVVFFSLHYFFESEQHLNGLFWNLFQSIPAGGTCLFTYIDPEDLRKKFLQADVSGEITFSINTNPIFKFKKYAELGEGYNMKVGFKSMNISGMDSPYIDEYIIDMKIFEAKCAEFKFRIIKHLYFKDYLDHPEDTKTPDLEKLLEFSNMHKILVIQKQQDAIDSFIENNGVLLPKKKNTTKRKKPEEPKSTTVLRTEPSTTVLPTQPSTAQPTQPSTAQVTETSTTVIQTKAKKLRKRENNNNMIPVKKSKPDETKPDSTEPEPMELTKSEEKPKKPKKPRKPKNP